MPQLKALFIATAMMSFTLYSEEVQTLSYMSGEPLKKGQISAGYSESAAYQVMDGFDVYATADFIYWCLEQDSVKVGKKVTPESSGAIGLFTGLSKTVYLDPGYKPGFQVGLGFDMSGMDNWNVYSEYSWYQNSNTTSSQGEVVLGEFGADIVVAEKASLHSDFHYNNLNLSLQRPFYLGRKITANFGFGLRGLWLSQELSLNASHLDAFPIGTFSELSMDGSLTINSKQKSWAIGPRISFETNWLLGAGIRIIADAAASILYTRYTQLQESIEGAAAYGIISDLMSETNSNFGVLRAVTEAFLGLGWGDYLGKNKRFHLDVLLGYDFNIYWNQNMSEVIAHEGSPQNTYLHGLNLAIRFDF